VENENEVEEICQKLSISFGGSGMKNTSGYDRINQDLDDPVLLSAPVKMNQKADLLKPASTSTFLLGDDCLFLTNIIHLIDITISFD
jgi:hypothetical protein